jgi:hypothetical protein
MPLGKPVLLKKSVSFKKSNEDAVSKGDLELYDDRVVLKISHRFSLSSPVSPLPPTFSRGRNERVYSLLANYGHQYWYGERVSFKKCEDRAAD